MAGQPSLLALFPALESPIGGGIQAAGQIARQALRSSFTVRCFYYGPDAEKGLPASDVIAPTRLSALWQAARGRWTADLVMVWHVHLLRLLPFFNLPKARIAVFLHGIECWRPLDWWSERAMKNVDCFLTNSDYTRDRFLGTRPWLTRARTETTALGLGHPAPASPPPGAIPAALMLGRMAIEEDYKGHREMIGVWPRVLADVPDAELWIAGGGSLRPALEAVVREQGLERHVHFLGYISEEEKLRRLEQCRCLALPSRGEGFGLVYLEAMRLGRPCLTSTLDAGSEVIAPPEAGLAVDPGDTTGLHRAVRRLLGAGAEWEQWSRQARHRY
ncbi:MAG TPA: hypothetical protein DEH78_15840, partial [Solibacterales bacterium]|nr:hypothetical protein [Bryobacterales bacterium]